MNITIMVKNLKGPFLIHILKLVWFNICKCWYMCIIPVLYSLWQILHVFPYGLCVLLTLRLLCIFIFHKLQFHSALFGYQSISQLRVESPWIHHLRCFDSKGGRNNFPSTPRGTLVLAHFLRSCYSSGFQKHNILWTTSFCYFEWILITTRLSKFLGNM